MYICWLDLQCLDPLLIQLISCYLNYPIWKKRAKNEREEELILEARKGAVEKNASHHSSLISSWNESSKNWEAYKLGLILRITNCFSS